MARFMSLSVLVALASVAMAAPAVTNVGKCSKDQMCNNLHGVQKAGNVDVANSRWGKMVTSSTHMSVADFLVQVCGDKPVSKPSPKPAEPAPKAAPAPPTSNAKANSNNANNDDGPSNGSSGNGPSNGGGSGGGSGAASGDEARYLNFHNNLRAKHGASAMTWDDGLAASAQAWANQCQFKHSQSGQNLAAGTGDYSIEDALGSWADEQSLYSGPGSSGAGHYTQMVWKGSTKLGCAVAPSCSSIFPGSVAKYYVCHYNPAGNVIGNFPANVS